LVYADALDESRAPVHTARAEFIRAQIALEGLADTDPNRAPLVARCDALFAEHWIDWWRPVCAAVGLPEPFVPGPRFRDRLKRFIVGDERAAGDPYTRAGDFPGACAISSRAHGFTAQFLAGFPELLHLTALQSDRLERWAGAVPLARLRWINGGPSDPAHLVVGAHLERVNELILGALVPDAAEGLARSGHLRGLRALTAWPVLGDVRVVRFLIAGPVWTGLRSLTLTGLTRPDVILVLAEPCALPELEGLSFSIRGAPVPAPVTGLSGPVGAVLTETFGHLRNALLRLPGRIDWPEHWPAFTVLARAPLLSQLRRLRVTLWDRRDLLPEETPHPINTANTGTAPPDRDRPSPDSLFPIPLVRALADGLNPDRLVRLELPAVLLAPESSAELNHRFGPRFVPV
jgi:hypothetical protein